MSFDVLAVRKEFPILTRTVNGKPLVYLDNAATTHKPQCVIDALVDYYSTCNSNVHRGAHKLADEATRRFEGARDIIAQFINAPSRNSVIWTSGTTESINIVANGLSQLLQTGDEVVVTSMEHHANLVTWQQACAKNGAKLKIVPVNDLGELDVVEYTKLVSPKTKLVAFPHVSNALGTVNPIVELTQIAKEVDALVLIDGAQGIAHGDVRLVCGCSAMETHFMKLPTNSSCADVASRGSLELGSQCCNRGQTIFTRYELQHSVVPFCELVWLTISRLSHCCS